MSVGQAKKAVRFLMVSCKLEKVRASGGINAFRTRASVITTRGSFPKASYVDAWISGQYHLQGVVLGCGGIATVTKMLQ